MNSRILRRKGAHVFKAEVEEAEGGAETTTRTPARLGKFRMEHWAWLFLFFNLIRFLPRGQDVTGLDPHSAYRILLVMLASVIVVLNLIGNSRSLASLLRIPLLFLFIYSLAALGSTLSASVAFYSMWKAIEVLVLAGAVAVLLGLPDAGLAAVRTYRITIILIGMLCFSPWISAVIDPGTAFYPNKGMIPVMLSGILPPLNPNTVGFMASVTSLILLIRFLQHRNRRILFGTLLLLAIVTLFFSNSRTGIAAFILGTATYLIVDKKKIYALLLGVVGSLVIIIGPVQEVAVEYLQRGQHIESIKTMSGRTNTWKVAYEYFLKSPYVGHGFASAGRFDVLQGRYSHLHGTIFEVLVGLGLMGLVPWLSWIIFTGILLLKAWRNVRFGFPDQARMMIAECAGLFTILIVRSATSSGLYAHNVETMLFCSIMMLLMAKSWKYVGR